MCERETKISHRPKKKTKDDGNEEDSVSELFKMNLSSLSAVSLDPWEHVLDWRGGGPLGVVP